MTIIIYELGGSTKITAFLKNLNRYFLFVRSLDTLLLFGLIYGEKFAFQIDLATLIDGRKFTVFALFYFVFEGNFLVHAPGGHIFGGGGGFNGGFFALQVYFLRGLYMEGLIFGILRYTLDKTTEFPDNLQRKRVNKM